MCVDLSNFNLLHYFQQPINFYRN